MFINNTNISTSYKQIYILFIQIINTFYIKISLNKHMINNKVQIY